jgi:cysteine-rich repeat protein
MKAIAITIGLFFLCACVPKEEGVCGDNVVDNGEECDDGNTVGGDGCDFNCKIEIPPGCGNGNLDAGEQCDDGNTVGGDGCGANCQVEPSPGCGDGNLDAGEQCDDGNSTNGDGCNANCQIEGGVDPVLEGSFTLENERDFEELDGITTITGNLVINAAGLADVTLPEITTLGGLSINGAESVSLPNLVNVGNSVFISSFPNPTSVSLPLLTNIGGDLSLQGGNDFLVSLDLSSLEIIGGGMQVFALNSLSFLDFPSLISINGGFLSGTIGLRIFNNVTLENINFPSLATIARDVIITGNTNLPTCQAQGLVAQLTPPPPSVTISGNDDAGICP